MEIRLTADDLNLLCYASFFAIMAVVGILKAARSGKAERPRPQPPTLTRRPK